MIVGNEKKPHRYLLYIGQNYSFEILRPIQQELRDLSIEVAWFVSGKCKLICLFFQSDEKVFISVIDVIRYKPYSDTCAW